MAFTIGDWRVEPAANELHRGAERLKLEPRAMKVLLYLAARANQVVSKDELIAEVWDRVAISDHSVAIVISQLRQKLQDDREVPRYIETIAKRGYRLIAPVSKEGETGTLPVQQSKRFELRRWHLLAGAIVLIITGGAGLGLARWNTAQNQTAQQTFIALADFTNATGDKRYDVMAFALSELVSTTLNEYSYATFVRYEHAPKKDALDASSRTGRSNLVTGRLILDGSQPLLTLQGSDLEVRRILWGQTYRITATSMEAQSREIARDIATAIGDDLREIPTAHPAPLPAAAELYWQARLIWSHRVDDSPRRARDLLVQALTIDPGYAVAHAAIADIYAHKSGEHLGLPRLDTFKEAEWHLAQAVKLGGVSSEVEVTRAVLAFYRDRDFAQAEAHAKAAIELNRENTLAWQTLGMIESARGRFNQCLAAIEHARSLEPDSYSVLWDRVWFLYLAGRPTDALAAAESAKRLWAPIHLYYAFIYHELGREQDALTEWIARAAENGLDPAVALGANTELAGLEPREAYARLPGVLAHDPNYRETPMALAAIRLLGGDQVGAAKTLISDPAARDSWLSIWFPRVPLFAPLRTEKSLASYFANGKS